MKKQQQIPCNRRGFVLFYYGAVNYSFSFDARGCDTLGCIATQRRVGFLVELAYYFTIDEKEKKDGKQKNSYPFESLRTPYA